MIKNEQSGTLNPLGSKAQSQTELFTAHKPAPAPGEGWLRAYAGLQRPLSGLAQGEWMLSVQSVGLRILTRANRV